MGSIHHFCHALTREEVIYCMEQPINLNTAIFIGIDSHPSEHTALAINRFEEEKGVLRFENTKKGIQECIAWLRTLASDTTQLFIGIEGGEALASYLLDHYSNLFEVNPVFTKQRRMLGTRHAKSDPADAKLIAEVVTRKLAQLPKFHMRQFSSERFCLRKTVKFYEEITVQGARLKNRLHQLDRDYTLARTKQEQNILALIRKEKCAELKRITLLQKKLTGQLSTLLTVQGANLTTIKGVSTILAARIVAHANGIDRFPKVSKFIRYAGIAPVERSSGKRKRHLRDMRNNRQLNTVMFLTALNQLRWNEKAKAYFKKKVSEGKTKKHALRCLMRINANIIYGMLKSGEPYRG
jgi:transposase